MDKRARKKLKKSTRLSDWYVRRLLHKIFKNFLSADQRFQDVFDCSINELRKWIEGQFRDGMHWRNYGKWWIVQVNCDDPHWSNVLPKLRKPKLHKVESRALKRSQMLARENRRKNAALADGIS